MSPGWVGRHPSSSRVNVLEAGLSTARKPASKPKCSPASSGATATRGCRDAVRSPRRRADRHALVGDRVQCRPRRGALQRQPEQVRSIEPVHGGPSVGPAADVAGDARSRAMPTRSRGSRYHLAVHGRWEAHHGRADVRDARESVSGRSPSGCAPPSAAPYPGGARPSRSVTTRPRGHAERAGGEENGRSEPASASPNVSIARRSAAAAPGSPR